MNGQINQDKIEIREISGEVMIFNGDLGMIKIYIYMGIKMLM